MLCHRSGAPAAGHAQCLQQRCSNQASLQQLRPRRAKCQHCLVAASASAANNDGQQLASDFASLVNNLGVHSPLANRRPSPMLSPTAAVAAQMDALQMNDWPDADAGVATAYAFTRAMDCEQLITGQAPRAGAVRGWGAKEQWLRFSEFQEQLHGEPYAPMLGCDSWRPISRLVFPSRRHSNKAVQAVEVVAARGASPQQQRQQQQQQWQQQRQQQQRQQQQQQQQQGLEQQALGSSDEALAPHLRRYKFSFCLERIEEGPYKHCWLTTGVRVGDYSH